MRASVAMAFMPLEKARRLYNHIRPLMGTSTLWSRFTKCFSHGAKRRLPRMEGSRKSRVKGLARAMGKKQRGRNGKQGIHQILKRELIEKVLAAISAILKLLWEPFAKS